MILGAYRVSFSAITWVCAKSICPCHSSVVVLVNQGIAGSLSVSQVIEISVSPESAVSIISPESPESVALSTMVAESTVSVESVVVESSIFCSVEEFVQDIVDISVIRENRWVEQRIVKVVDLEYIRIITILGLCGHSIEEIIVYITQSNHSSNRGV